MSCCLEEILNFLISLCDSPKIISLFTVVKPLIKNYRYIELLIHEPRIFVFLVFNMHAFVSPFTEENCLQYFSQIDFLGRFTILEVREQQIDQKKYPHVCKRL